MKKYLALMVAIIFIFAVSSIAISQEKPAAPAKPADTKPVEPAKPAAKADEKKAEKPKVKQVTGEVAAVDMAAKSITVKGRKADVTMTADPKLLEGVKVGDKVVAKYTVQDGKNVAKSIKPAKPKAEKPKAEAKPVDPVKPAAKPETKPAEPPKK